MSSPSHTNSIFDNIQKDVLESMLPLGELLKTLQTQVSELQAQTKAKDREIKLAGNDMRKLLNKNQQLTTDNLRLSEQVKAANTQNQYLKQKNSALSLASEELKAEHIKCSNQLEQINRDFSRTQAALLNTQEQARDFKWKSEKRDKELVALKAKHAKSEQAFHRYKADTQTAQNVAKAAVEEQKAENIRLNSEINRLKSKCEVLECKGKENTVRLADLAEKLKVEKGQEDTMFDDIEDEIDSILGQLDIFHEMQRFNAKMAEKTIVKRKVKARPNSPELTVKARKRSKSPEPILHDPKRVKAEYGTVIRTSDIPLLC